MKRSTLIAGGVALALVLAAGGGYAYSLANARTTVGVVPATVEALSIAVSASGTVDAARQRNIHPVTGGTLPTHGPLFVLLLAGTVLLVGLLNYVPALALGPVVEHLMLWHAE